MLYLLLFPGANHWTGKLEQETNQCRLRCYHLLLLLLLNSFIIPNEANDSYHYSEEDEENAYSSASRAEMCIATDQALDNFCNTFAECCGFLHPDNPNVTLEYSNSPLNVTCRLRKAFAAKYFVNSSSITFAVWDTMKREYRNISQRYVSINNKLEAMLLTDDVTMHDNAVRCSVFIDGIVVPIGKQHLEVGKVPSKPINVAAVINNWNTSMTLSWEEEGVNVHFQAYYVGWWRDRGGGSDRSAGWSPWRLCNGTEKKELSEKMYCLVDGINTTEDKHIQVKVNATNRIPLTAYSPEVGSNTSETVNFTINEIIIPASVVAVRVSALGSKWAQLEWNITNLLRHPLTYRLNLTCRWAEECPRSLKVENSADWSVSHIVSDLHPYTFYNASINCLSSNGGRLWSKAFYFTFTTEQDAPTAAPPVQTSGYISRIVAARRDVTLFWQMVPEEHRNGEITGYSILQQKGETLHLETVKISGDEFSYTVQNLSVDVSYNFFVFAHTAVGTYGKGEPIRVEISKYEPSYPDYMFVAESESHVEVKWQAKEDLKELVVYWCHGNGNQETHCSGEISWANFPGSAGHGRVELGPGQLYRNYLYFVAARYNTNTGMQLVQCVYDITNMPARPRESRLESREINSIEFRLETSCSKHPGITREYEFAYCHFEGEDCGAVDIEAECRDHIMKRRMNVSENYKYSIDSLDPNSNYLISARGLSGTGMDSISTQFCIKTSPAPWYYKFRIPIIVVAVLLFLCILIGMWKIISCWRKRVLRFWQWTKVPIATPGDELQEDDHNVHRKQNGRFNKDKKAMAEVLPFIIQPEPEDDGGLKALDLRHERAIFTVSQPVPAPREDPVPIETDTSSINSEDDIVVEIIPLPSGDAHTPSGGRFDCVPSLPGGSGDSSEVYGDISDPHDTHDTGDINSYAIADIPGSADYQETSICTDFSCKPEYDTSGGSFGDHTPCPADVPVPANIDRGSGVLDSDISVDAYSQVQAQVPDPNALVTSTSCNAFDDVDAIEPSTQSASTPTLVNCAVHGPSDSLTSHSSTISPYNQGTVWQDPSTGAVSDEDETDVSDYSPSRLISKQEVPSEAPRANDTHHKARTCSRTSTINLNVTNESVDYAPTSVVVKDASQDIQNDTLTSRTKDRNNSENDVTSNTTNNDLSGSNERVGYAPTTVVRDACAYNNTENDTPNSGTSYNDLNTSDDIAGYASTAVVGGARASNVYVAGQNNDNAGGEGNCRLSDVDADVYAETQCHYDSFCETPDSDSGE